MIFSRLLDFGIWLQYGKLQSRAERSANRSTARKFCCSPSPLHVVWNVGNFSVLNCKSAVLNLVLYWHCCIALLYRKSVKNRNYRAAVSSCLHDNLASRPITGNFWLFLNQKYFFDNRSAWEKYSNFKTTWKGFMSQPACTCCKPEIWDFLILQATGEIRRPLLFWNQTPWSREFDSNIIQVFDHAVWFQGLFFSSHP